MAGSLTLDGRNAVLNGTAMPTTLHLQQHTGDPGIGTSNVSTDCASGSRRSFTRTTAADGSTENATVMEVTLTVAETYTHWSLWSAGAAGTCWWIGTWDTPRSYLPGDIARVRVGDLDLSIT